MVAFLEKKILLGDKGFCIYILNKGRAELPRTGDGVRTIDWVKMRGKSGDPPKHPTGRIGGKFVCVKN